MDSKEKSESIVGKKIMECGKPGNFESSVAVLGG